MTLRWSCLCLGDFVMRWTFPWTPVNLYSSYTFASGSPDNIKQWKFPDGGFLQNLSGHNSNINMLAVNADWVLVFGSDNGTMHLWDWRTGYNFQLVHAAVQPGSLDSDSGIFASSFDQSESWLLTAETDKTIKVYREDENATEETHPVSWKPEIIKRIIWVNWEHGVLGGWLKGGGERQGVEQRKM